MAVASRDRFRIVAPDTCDAKTPSERIRLAMQRAQAIRERLAWDEPATPVPPSSFN